jgi:dipeptidase
MYTCMTSVPKPFAVGNGNMMTFSDNAAFWIFNQVSNFAYTRYKDMIPEIQQKQKELESLYMSMIAVTDKKAATLYKQNPATGIKFLTDFSVRQGNNTFSEWKKLYGYLFTKFMDGNIKTPSGKLNPNLSQPGYSPEFYRNLVKQTGDKFKVLGKDEN